MTVGMVSSIHVVLCGLFEGTQYNSEAGATRAVNLRARINQGNMVDSLYKKSYTRKLQLR